ncbi:MAG: diacylglycerol kinase family protein [Bacteroidales bacterium]
MKNSGFTLRKRLKSFRYAFSGIYQLVRYEHNAWIHLLCMVAVIIAGVLLDISTMEWIVVTFAIGGVIATEAFNSALEQLADVVSPEYNQGIKRTKDLAAAAVLIVAITAAIVGLIIFLPKIINLF